MNFRGSIVGDEQPSDQNLEIGPYPPDEQILVLAAERDETVISLDRPREKAVILGRSSRVAEEIDLSVCRQDGIRLYRRRGGGCSVFVDEGTLDLSIVLVNVTTLDINRLFRCFSQWMIMLLDRQGFSPIYQAGTSDLVMDNRKIAGSCLYRRHNIVLFSSSLLFHPQIELFERYLRHPPREPVYRNGRSHRDFLRPLLDTIEQHESRFDTIIQNLGQDAQQKWPQLFKNIIQVH